MELVDNRITREQNTLKEIISNFRESVTIINNYVTTKGYMRVVNGQEVKDLDFSINKNKYNPFNKSIGDSLETIFDSSLTKSQRKNIAKRLWNVEKKPSRRSINTLFLVLRKYDVLKENIKINLSAKEQKIQAKRKVWIKLRNEADVALQSYKKEKGNFYK